MRIKWFSLIRVCGLLLVLLYHFFKNTFPGGFIGVDVFFTFSGYLITVLLIDEYARNKRINLLAFFRRRFYRIVPPLVLMILCIMPFVYLVRSDFIAGIGRQIAAALGFATNFYEIITGGNYETQFIPHLFVHTWSLAIEVHFYIIWGFLVWWLARQGYDKNKLRSLVFILSAALFALSFGSMFIRAFFVDNVSRIYFSTLSHTYPFFLGAMVATLSGVAETTARFKRNSRLWSVRRTLSVFAGSFSLLLILSLLLDFNSLVTYLFGFFLASFFTVLMIYAARVLHDKTADLKEPLIITFLADISYGMYLFHWPFYIIFSQLLPNVLAVLLTLFFSLVFSALSYYIIEPFIAGKKIRLLGVDFNLTPYKKWLYGTVGFLSALTLVTVIVAPRVGAFETELTVNSLKQAQMNLERTHTLAAGDASALSDVMVIGDSVALRSSDAFASLLPEAQLDASVSRDFDDAFTIFRNHLDSGTLSKVVVLAVGVNSLDQYKEDLDQFVEALPDGYRLVLVTPYNSKNITQVSEVREYELLLAKTYDYLTVADWYQAAVDNPDIWNGTDGVHYSDADEEGANLYVETIQKAVQKAAKHPAKGESE
ncbi:acyltransferase [Streptococcus chenjunshii]|uniref:Acyltransferase n=1 Tax=Streptococcus chenjunshii TaxID=2173853 RepID=A0A372KKK6_9STRE|nr:acyltransferase family protein [Streptococcus chenjunshii]AXQ77663.1 acyltransferase [Streptococcus chenjunshii]RFU50646.1 acyltransferase [Streptococcus chenjunshii]RFU52819.1 acyltransferase [Streptococcus chenjunshii]